MPWPRLLVGLAVAIAAVALFVALRPAGDEEAAPEPLPTATASTPPATETAPDTDAAESEPEPAAPALPTLSVVLRDGLPDGGVQRLTVRRDDEVRIVVRSDAPDDLHLHGYDLERPVGPGAPAQMRLRATVPGRFELETHRRHVVVGELEVQP